MIFNVSDYVSLDDLYLHVFQRANRKMLIQFTFGFQQTCNVS